MKTTEELLKKYIAIKVKANSYYIWFETEKTAEVNGEFVGKDGWSSGGVLTNINCDSKQIKSIIYSDELFYKT
jgi:hypothetical protein